ncbi:MAG: DUF5615 family PIN-like protein [Alphaproteobacteria bacterium]|nr:DUF5615 family PIN-like protein [Alphaproteobacteria bacterium]
MKIRADEHIAPKIVRAIQMLVLRAGWEISHVRDVHDARTADETWIPRFAREGGQVILSGDRKMLARPHQIKAIAESGVIGVFLSSQWAQAQRHIQAAHLIHCWPEIERALLESKERDCWKVPFEYGAVTLQKLSVNYSEALGSSK